MPRRPRLALPNVPQHLIQRGNNRQACFVADEDFRFYLDWLGEYAGKAGCRVHACVLMTNHVHLLVSSSRGAAPGEMMKALVQQHEMYAALGLDAASRQAAYRELFRHELEPGLADEIRRATNGNYALGSALFAEQIGAALGRRVVPGKSGRPRKAVEPVSGELFG